MFWFAIFRRFRNRRRGEHSKTVEQILKYTAGGWLYFWSGYAIFAFCYSVLHWSWLPSKILCDIVGWTLNYLVQRHWAFAEQHHLSEMQHATRYVFIESLGFILDYVMIGGLKAIGITPYIGFFISAGFFDIWSWFWYKYWVFPDKLKGGAKEAAHGAHS